MSYESYKTKIYAHHYFLKLIIIIIHIITLASGLVATTFAPHS